MKKFEMRRIEDEPPSEIPDPKSNDRSVRSIKYTVGNVHRLLFWRWTLLRRSGRLMSAGGSISSRWVHLVLGTGEHEG